MNIYVETNFILELVFVQEQHQSCEEIITLCEAGRAKLILPAFCIAEAYEALIRRANRRKQMANDLAGELRQLSRSAPYRGDTEALQSLVSLLTRSSQEEDERLTATLERILRVADIIPLATDVVLSAKAHRATYKLEAQDSIVYSAVLYHLKSAGAEESCFLNRNSRDFDDPDIEESLSAQGCKTLFSFVNGFQYIRHRVSESPSS
jgi:predicted nucleic acid-binding protein